MRLAHRCAETVAMSDDENDTEDPSKTLAMAGGRIARDRVGARLSAGHCRIRTAPAGEPRDGRERHRDDARR